MSDKKITVKKTFAELSALRKKALRALKIKAIKPEAAYCMTDEVKN